MKAMDTHLLADCAFCPRECHVNRLKGATGWCKSGAGFRINSICLHHGEEPPVSGDDGICNIFFTNCNLQCIYCQNWQISDNKLDHGSDEMEFDGVIDRIISFLEKGITRVGFVSPSHVIPQMLTIIHEIEDQGYHPVWVYNSNGYDKVETLKRLEGIIDVYLPDLKYLDPALSKEYSGAGNYPETAMSALREMYRQKGAALHTADDGTITSGIIIRHLVLPGEVQNSLDVVRFIAEELSPNLHISLMSQYFPTPAVASHPRLNRTVSREEYKQVTDEMERLGLCKGWIQQPESQDHYRPDFRRENPFG